MTLAERRKIFGESFISPSKIGNSVYCTRLAYLSHLKLTKDHPRLTLGRQLHLDWKIFNERWIEEVRQNRRMKIRQLEAFLKNIRDQIVRSIEKNRIYKRHLQSLLANYSLQISHMAHELLQGNRIHIKELLIAFFGSEDPSFEYRTNIGDTYFRVDGIGISNDTFTVLELKTGKTPEEARDNHVLQIATAAVFLEEILQRPCHQMVIIYPERRINFPLTNRLKNQVFYEQGTYNSIMRRKNPPEIENTSRCKTCLHHKVCYSLKTTEKHNPNLQHVVIDKNEGESSNLVRETDEQSQGDCPSSPNSISIYLGSVVQNPKYASSFRNGKDNLIWAKVKEKQVEKFRDGDLVIIESPQKSIKVFCEVLEICTFPATAALNYNSTGELVTNVKLNPILEIGVDGNRERPHQRDYHEYLLRKVSATELAQISKISSEGIPLGLLVDNSNNYHDKLPSDPVIYRFPIDRMNQGYKGIFLTGSPGKGKSNALKVMICGMSQYYTDGSPPAVIIIDVEGEYRSLNQPGLGSTFDQEFWQNTSLKPVENLNIFTISKESVPGTHALDFSQLGSSEITLMFPMLPGKSSQQFEQLSKQIMKKDFKLSFETFRREMISSVQRNPDIHDAQRDAITRALNSGIEDVFEQHGQLIDVPSLLKPGSVSVIDCSQILDYNLIRIIALYIFLALKQYKIDLHNYKAKTIMIFDEAHTIFPKSSQGQMETDYLDRVMSQVENIIRIGRKRKYGFIFASQLPGDIAKNIVNLCQTKIIMGLENENWVANVLGSPKYVRSVTRFSQGDAYVHCVDFHEQPLRIKFPKAPCEHENR